MCHAVVIEKAGKGYSGKIRELPGCVASGASIMAVKVELPEVLRFIWTVCVVPAGESVVERERD